MNNLLEFAYLYNEGTEYFAYKILGAHLADNGQSVRFCVYAPSAKDVFVVGDFNDWDGAKNHMEPIGTSGLHFLEILGLGEGAHYKYLIHRQDSQVFLKADPYAFSAQLRSNTASIVCDPFKYRWKDELWLEKQRDFDITKAPMNIYEVHLTSWKQACSDSSGIDLSAMGDELIDYCVDLGYTHIELLPVMEHPLDASWGYQITGYYALTGRIGPPYILQQFVDKCHIAGLGVILDWVPGHYCKDAHGLYDFDGTFLYGSDEHPQWGTMHFDYSKGHVNSFMVSNAMFWLNIYHVDGLRVDGVSSMIYLNFGRDAGTRVNEFGGDIDLGVLEFFKKLNGYIHKTFAGKIMIAEESSAYDKLTANIEDGGLGFDYKWNMGWMNDTLGYMEKESIHKRYHHNDMTFSMVYTYDEKYVLPFSHDEVVHGKKSMVDKMPGDHYQKFAALRALYLYQMTHPGKKLNFMGNDFAPFLEWRFYEPLEWHMLDYPRHKGMNSFFKKLNHIYLENPQLWELDHDRNGFTWLDADDNDRSIFAYMRRGKLGEPLLMVMNFTPAEYPRYRLGVPIAGIYEQLINSAKEIYGGYMADELLSSVSIKERCHGRENSIEFFLPGLTAIIFKREI